MGVLQIEVRDATTNQIAVAAPLICDYTAHHGFVPGVIEITCAPQDAIPSLVNVFMSDGVNFVTLSDCLVDNLNVSLTPAGHVERLFLFDRRWRWHQKGEISGTYNVRNLDGTVVSATDRSPQQLATLAFQSMYEGYFDVSNLPNDASDRPHVSWEIDNPQDVLQWLCDRAGCDLAPNWATNQMVLVQLGVGASLPGGDVQTVSAGINRGPVTDQVVIVCGYTLHQSKFYLEPMGLDVDGKYKPHGQLSYGADLLGIGIGSADAPIDSTAPYYEFAKTAFRTFRIGGFAAGGWVLPTTGQDMVSREGVLPLRRNLLTGTVAPDGSIVEDKPSIEGIFMLGNLKDSATLVNSGSGEPYEGSFSIDYETGLVHMTEPVYRITGGGDYSLSPATLYLTAAHKVRDYNRGVGYQRYYYTLPVGSGGTGAPPYIVRRDDLELQYTAAYDRAQTSPTSIYDNQSNIDAAIASQVNALSATFGAKASSFRRWAGIIPIPLDGVVRQVRWRVQCGRRGVPGGAWTWAAANTECVPGVMRLNERRRVAALDNLLRANTARGYARWSKLRQRDRE